MAKVGQILVAIDNQGPRAPRDNHDRIQKGLDRKPHKGELLDALDHAASRRLIAVFMDGEEGQGHAVIRQQLGDELEQRIGTVPRLDQSVETYIEWPTADPRRGVRLRQLLESVGAWFGADPPPEALFVKEAIDEAWRAWLEHLKGRVLAAVRIDPVLLVHRLDLLQADDVWILELYLQHLWHPVVTSLQAASSCRVVLAFEVERARSGFWLTPLWWRWRRGRRIASDLGARIGAWRPAGIMRCLVPELGLVPLSEVVALLTNEFDLPDEAATAIAREAWIESGRGRFVPLVDHLERRLRAATIGGRRAR